MWIKVGQKVHSVFFLNILWKFGMKFLANTIQWPLLSLYKILIFQQYLLELTEKHLLATYFLWLECSHWFLFLFLLYEYCFKFYFSPHTSVPWFLDTMPLPSVLLTLYSLHSWVCSFSSFYYCRRILIIYIHTHKLYIIYIHT